MHSSFQTVRVNLGARAYDVLIGRGLLGSLGDLLWEKMPGAVALISDRVVAVLYAVRVKGAVREAGLSPV